MGLSNESMADVRFVAGAHFVFSVAGRVAAAARSSAFCNDEGMQELLDKLDSHLIPRVGAAITAAEAALVTDTVVVDWVRRLTDIAHDADDILDDIDADKAGQELKRIVLELAEAFAGVERLDAGGAEHTVAAPRRYIKATPAKPFLFMSRKEYERVLGMLLGNNPSPAEPASTADEDEESEFHRRGWILRRLLGRHMEPEEETVEAMPAADIANVGVLPIVGVGGVGKTFLARFLFDDTRVVDRFHTRAWVPVPDAAGKEEFLQAVLSSLPAPAGKNSAAATAAPASRIRDVTMNKRILIVLDGVWDDVLPFWDALRGALSKGLPASVVVVTTRRRSVATAVGTVGPVFLRPFADELLLRALEHHASPSPAVPELVERLRGLPMAAKIVGAVLRCTGDDRVVSSPMWSRFDSGIAGDVLPSLAVGYEHLDGELRQCFGFLSVFPKRHVYEKERIVHVWAALGFIRAGDGEDKGATVEQLGRECFDELVGRGFLQPLNAGKFVMLDLVWEFAVAVARPHFAARNSFVTGADGLDNTWTTCCSLVDVLSSSASIRVLDLSNRAGESVQAVLGTIARLRNLRLLNVAHTDVTELPESICDLRHLMVLDVRGCPIAGGLPAGMSRLASLRHLYADATAVSQIAGLGRLTALQELEEFHVRRKHGNRISELRDMNGLRGRLRIAGVDEVSTEDEASSAKLSLKRHLRAVHFSWKAAARRSLPFADAAVLDQLRPHSLLQELALRGYGGRAFPSWLPEMNGLIRVDIAGCSRLAALPPLGHLPQLRLLHVGDLQCVTRVGSELYGSGEVIFPGLEELTFADMPNWERWTGAGGRRPFMPRLRKLAMHRCSRLGDIPVLQQPLTHLELRSAGGFLRSLSSATALTALRLYDYPAGTVHLPCHRLPNLQELVVVGIGTLRIDAGLRYLFQLKKLEIRDCADIADTTAVEMAKRRESYKAMLMPERRALTDLCVDDCFLIKNRFETLGKVSPSLRRLKLSKIINGFRFTRNGQLQSWLQSLYVLQSLEFADCSGIDELPAYLPSMSSVKMLVISNCPKIERLPANGLPPELRELRIARCSVELAKGCRPEGEEWEKVERVACIRVDDVIVQAL